MVPGNDPFMFTLHTSLRDSTYFDEDLKATFAIVHGYGENSDIFLETALQYALNGFDVHLIDLRGYGLSGSARMSRHRVHDYHHDVSVLLQMVNPKLPLFIYGHSMGGLTILTYLMNNPDLNIAGVVLSAPFLGIAERQNVDEAKKLIVRFLAPHLDVSYQLLIN
jgi:alpha-beta hydrolase superfamily lysophospholipase